MTLSLPGAGLAVRTAATPAEVEAAQRLRHRVFVEELGARGGACPDLESDRFDALAHHVLLIDESGPGPDRVVGACRLLDATAAEQAGGFYSEAEFDLTPLRASGLGLMELGRACLDAGHRGGPGLALLWQGVARHVLATGTEVLFGVASFHGADAGVHAEPLRLLHSHHLAPPELRPVSRQEGGPDLGRPPADRRAATLAVPGLIRSYLRLGGRVGQGVFRDRAFNTTDVCMVLDRRALTASGRALLGAGR